MSTFIMLVVFNYNSVVLSTKL